MASALAVLAGSAVLVSSGFLTLILMLRLFSPRPRPPTALSLRYLTASSGGDTSSTETSSLPKLPSTLDSAATLELSVVIPAYDEELRLRDGISSALDFLEARRVGLSSKGKSGGKTWAKGSYEVIIVDDGSKDRTVEVALEIAKEHRRTVLASAGGTEGAGEVRIVRLGRNRGKGGAVRHGMLHARGAKILFADADGASHFPDLEKLLAAYDRIAASTPRRRPSRPPSELPSLSSQIPETWGSLSPSLSSSRRPSVNPSAEEEVEEEGEEEDQAMVLGSRAHLVSSPSVVSRSPLRNLLMRAFHLYLYVLGVRAVKDTQCGFKLLSRGTVRDLVSALHVEGWIFDVELLLLSSLLRPPVPVEEVPIAWSEVGGSKLSVVRDSAIMALELLIIRLNYGLGVWSVPHATSRPR